jgi:hypothetical protein
MSHATTTNGARPPQLEKCPGCRCRSSSTAASSATASRTPPSSSACTPTSGRGRALLIAHEDLKIGDEFRVTHRGVDRLRQTPADPVGRVVAQSLGPDGVEAALSAAVNWAGRSCPHPAGRRGAGDPGGLAGRRSATRHIGTSRRWKEHDAYQAAFRGCSDLQVEKSAGGGDRGEGPLQARVVLRRTGYADAMYGRASRRPPTPERRACGRTAIVRPGQSRPAAGDPPPEPQGEPDRAPCAERLEAEGPRHRRRGSQSAREGGRRQKGGRGGDRSRSRGRG